VIRLNYAGESGHHPQLAEAVALAAKSGAEVELVTALASLKSERLIDALDAGLTRLTVSLHTLDAAQFETIYRFSSLHSMLANLERVLDWQRRHPGQLVLDLAFVAMWRNLNQLAMVAEFAEARGIQVLAVHPLIGRDPLPMGAVIEHDATGRLGEDFRRAIEHAVDTLRCRHSRLSIQLSSHELEAARPLQATPQPWPGPLPNDALVSHCDQSPFDTVHILSDGRVVPCEVMEKRVMGRLGSAGLREIWNGETYRDLRHVHRSGAEAACQNCVYKCAHRAQPPLSRFEAAEMPAEQALEGWYPLDGSGVRWTAARGTFWLPRHARARSLELEGIVARGRPNAKFQVLVDGQPVHSQLREGSLRLRLKLPAATRDWALVELRRSGAASPAQLGLSGDVRELGFALRRVALV
jgi:MoaA/NifB/PqqE/SkfB family radical SAM enzyme